MDISLAWKMRDQFFRIVRSFFYQRDYTEVDTPIAVVAPGAEVHLTYFATDWVDHMGKPHPMELRTRVVDFVEEGNTHRATAAQFRVSIKFVNDMVKLRRETRSLEPKPQGRQGHGKLGGPMTGCAAKLRTNRM